MSRANEILDALSLRESTGFSQDEQNELLQSRLINVYSSSDYEATRNAARDIDTLTQQVRDLARAMDNGSGPKPRLIGNKKSQAEAGERYQAVLEQLEEASGKRAMLEMMVNNPVTNSYVSLSLDGKKAITDIAAWKARFGNEELGAFLGRMSSMRTSMENAVLRASRIVERFVSPRPGMIRPELRGPALIAAESGAGAEDLESAFHETPAGTSDYDAVLEEMPKEFDVETSGVDEDTDESSVEDEGDGPYDQEEDTETDQKDLFMTAFLSSGMGGENYRLVRFHEALSAVGGPAFGSGEPDLKAAAVADVPQNQTGIMVSRMNWLTANLTLADGNDVAWLARSQYPLDEVKSRYEGLDASIVAAGVQENSNLRTACAIMAGSSQPMDALPAKFNALSGQLKYVFDVPYVAAGMLASTPLSSDEAMHVYKEAVGAVSRGNYFDDAGEVENLALLLTNMYGPDAREISQQPASVPAQTDASQTTQQQTNDDQIRRQSTPWYYWYYWHNRYYGRPLFWNYRMHPGHMHTVPHFG